VLERVELEEVVGRGDVAGGVVGLECVELECTVVEEVVGDVSVLARFELEEVIITGGVELVSKIAVIAG
jgi:hypothetical protein